MPKSRISRTKSNSSSFAISFDLEDGSLHELIQLKDASLPRSVALEQLAIDIQPPLQKFENVQEVQLGCTGSYDRQCYAKEIEKKPLLDHVEILKVLAMAANRTDFKPQVISGVSFNIGFTSFRMLDFRAAMELGEWTSKLTYLDLQVSFCDRPGADQEAAEADAAREVAAGLNVLTHLLTLRLSSGYHFVSHQWIDTLAELAFLPRLSTIIIWSLDCEWHGVQKLLSKHATTLRKCFLVPLCIWKEVLVGKSKELIEYIKDDLDLEAVILRPLTSCKGDDGGQGTDKLPSCVPRKLGGRLGDTFVGDLNGREEVQAGLSEIISDIEQGVYRDPEPDFN